VVATVTVVDCATDIPVTVNGNVAPLAVPARTTHTWMGSPEPLTGAGAALTDGTNPNNGSKFVTLTVKPSDVATGASNAGTNAAPIKAEPTTVAEP
jgi:hypothetical protein